MNAIQPHRLPMRQTRCPLPWHSWSARWRWSLAALAVLAIWQYFILAAAVTSFPVRYTPWQVFDLVLHAKRDDFWPGEYGGHRTIYAFLQLGPLFALLVWLLGLVPWPRRWMRACWFIVAVVTPCLGAPVAIAAAPIAIPWTLAAGPVLAARLLLLGGDGEDHQDAGVFIGVSMWFWFLLVAIPLASRRRRVPIGCCTTCGYDLTGLQSTTCPECGTSQLH